MVEDEYEALLLGFLDSDTSPMSPPPGDLSSGGWATVTRRRKGKERRSTRLGSLWDVDTDMILGQPLLLKCFGIYF